MCCAVAAAGNGGGGANSGILIQVIQGAKKSANSKIMLDEEETE